MRSLTYPLLVVIATAFPGATFAQSEASDAEIAAARRELAAAKLDARICRQEEYTAAKRELNAEIRVADEEVRTMRRNLKSFGPYNPYAYGQLPAFHYRNARLFLAESEARRRLLIEERNDLSRTFAVKNALLQLKVGAARARLVELEGGGVIELNDVRPAANAVSQR